MTTEDQQIRRDVRHTVNVLMASALAERDLANASRVTLAARVAQHPYAAAAVAVSVAIAIGLGVYVTNLLRERDVLVARLGEQVRSVPDNSKAVGVPGMVVEPGRVIGTPPPLPSSGAPAAPLRSSDAPAALPTGVDTRGSGFRVVGVLQTYFGLTKDGGRYEVRAKEAIVEFKKDAPIKLIDVDGDLLQANDVTTKLKAKHGLLDNAKGELELYDGIEIDASNGMKARLSRAMVYSKGPRIVSKHPVDLSMPTGRVQGATMTMRSDTREATFVGAVKAHLVSGDQPGKTTPSTAPFGRESKDPIDVTADQLYVNDLAKTALFMGKVVAVQGDATLKTPKLHIAYEGRAAADAMTAAAQPQQPEDASRLSRLVAKSGIVITIGTDRRVSSDQVDFDAKEDTALFVGNVLVNQQKNVLQGKRLFIDRKAATSHLETPAEGTQPAGRIAATFYQNTTMGAEQPNSKPKSGPDNKGAAAQEGVMGSFKMDPNAPMDVEADTLDVYDIEKRAVFHGNVNSKLGDFVVRTVEMVAFYSGRVGLGLSAGGDEAASKTPSQLIRIEAKQKVLIVSKDGQSATGDWAIFDTKANTVLLGDDVTISRGKDVAQGRRLKIDLTTGMYRWELDPP